MGGKIPNHRGATVRAMYDLSELSSCGDDVIVAKQITVRHPKMIRLGSHVAIDEGFYCSTKLDVGDYIHIGAQCVVIGGPKSLLRIGNFCGMSAGCRIACGGDDFLGSGLIGPTVPREYRARVSSFTTTLEDFVQLGMGVIVLPGITIKQGAVVGAGSVVTHDCNPWTVYVGNPARPVRPRDRDRILSFASTLGYGMD